MFLNYIDELKIQNIFETKYGDLKLNYKNGNEYPLKSILKDVTDDILFNNDENIKGIHKLLSEKNINNFIDEISNNELKELVESYLNLLIDYNVDKDDSIRSELIEVNKKLKELLHQNLINVTNTSSSGSNTSSNTGSSTGNKKPKKVTKTSTTTSNNKPKKVAKTKKASNTANKKTKNVNLPGNGKEINKYAANFDSTYKGFIDAELKDKINTNSLFLITIDANNKNKATYQVVNSKAVHKRAIAHAQSFLGNACNFMDTPTAISDTIKTIKPGELKRTKITYGKLKGKYIWEIVIKSLIDFEITQSVTYTIRYFDFFDKPNGVRINSLDDNPTQNKTLYKMTVDSRKPNEATFLISGTQEAMDSAMANSKIKLNPSCENINQPEIGKTIETVEPGKLQYKKDVWELVKKVKIKFV